MVSQESYPKSISSSPYPSDFLSGGFLQNGTYCEDGLNWYVYCANNPLKYVDPTGLRMTQMTDEDEQQEAQDAQERNPRKLRDTRPKDSDGSSPRGNRLREKAEEYIDEDPEKYERLTNRARRADENYQYRQSFYALPDDVKQLVRNGDFTVSFYGSGAGFDLSAVILTEGHKLVGERVLITFYIEETGEAFSAVYYNSVTEREGYSISGSIYTLSLEGRGIYPEGTSPLEIAQSLEGPAKGMAFVAGPFGIGGYVTEDYEMSQGTFGASYSFAPIPGSGVSETTHSRMKEGSFTMLPSGEPEYWKNKREWMSRP